MYQAIKKINDSLEPYLSRKTLDYHYKIYQDNLNKLNQLLKQENYAYHLSQIELIKNINIFPLNKRGEILYYLSSIVNHNLYFYNLSSWNNIIPGGSFKEKIDFTYGSFDNFKREFIRAAMNLKGSGYTFLVIDDKNQFKIMNTSNEDSPYSYGFIPIIALDLWEHAYYLDYKDKREEYIDNFFLMIDFNKVEEYYQMVIGKRRM